MSKSVISKKDFAKHMAVFCGNCNNNAITIELCGSGMFVTCVNCGQQLFHMGNYAGCYDKIFLLAGIPEKDYDDGCTHVYDVKFKKVKIDEVA